MSPWVPLLFAMMGACAFLSFAADREAKDWARAGKADWAADARRRVRIYAGKGLLWTVALIVAVVTGAP